MKLQYIDAMRGLAILGVLIVHCGHYGSNEQLPGLIQIIIANGSHGVQLFYVVSAFTLFLTLDKEVPGARSTWTAFYLRRFFRIAPMYYLGICYFLWQDGLGPRYFLGDAPGITYSNIFANVFFIHGFNPYWITSVVPGGWSIAVEMMFYFLMPMLYAAIKDSRRAVVFLLISLAIRAALQFILNRVDLIGSERLWQEFLNFYLPSQLPVFGLGILFYFIVKEGYKVSLSPVLILTLSIVLITHLSGVPLIPNHVLFGFGFVGLGLALSKCEFRAIVNPVFVHLGRVSYSLYLTHFAVLFALNELGAVDYVRASGASGAIMNFVIRLLVLIVIGTAISTVFYRVIELPFQRLGKRLIGMWQLRMPAIQSLDVLSEAQIAPASSNGVLIQKGIVTDGGRDGVTNIEREK